MRRELTDLSLPKIGQLSGGRDHTTVMHADRKIRQLLGGAAFTGHGHAEERLRRALGAGPMGSEFIAAEVELSVSPSSAVQGRIGREMSRFGPADMVNGGHTYYAVLGRGARRQAPHTGPAVRLVV